MNWLKSKKIIITHSGNFHADEIFSIATLSLYLNRRIKIIRTRDLSILSKGDYVLDVGQVYDPASNRFDHHQEGGVGKRENGIPYATFGLVWKEFGEEICQSKEAAEIIERKLVENMDADDNGLNIFNNSVKNIFPYTISDYIIYMNATCSPQKIDHTFKKLVNFAKDIIEMEIKLAKDLIINEDLVKSAYNLAIDKRLIILDQDCSAQWILSNYPEPLFIIKPAIEINAWKVYAVKIKDEKFKNRLDLPSDWGGKKDGELARVTGVVDALYCHHQCYMAIAKSKQGAIKLAELALAQIKK